MIHEILQAAADAGDSIPFEPFLNYGVLGILTSILLVVVRILYKREQCRADENARQVVLANEKIENIYATMLNKQSPLLAQVISTMEKVVQILDIVQKDMNNKEFEKRIDDELQRRQKSTKPE